METTKFENLLKSLNEKISLFKAKVESAEANYNEKTADCSFSYKVVNFEFLFHNLETIYTLNIFNYLLETLKKEGEKNAEQVVNHYKRMAYNELTCFNQSTSTLQNAEDFEKKKAQKTVFDFLNNY